MGEMEKKSRQRSKRVRVEKILLRTIATAEGVMDAFLAPRALRSLKDGDPDWLRKRDPKKRISESAYLLKQKGLVEFRLDGGKKRLYLTDKGRRAMDSVWSEDFHLKLPNRWDGKWRLVIFDIPERRRNVRDKMRALMFRLGFLRLQDSVWVYPYACEELVTLLKTDLKTGRAVLYVIADAIEFDAPIRAHFGLPAE